MAAGRVAEVFRSLQGEGTWAGAPQLFLRLAGCSLGCPWCDTRAAWEAPARFPAPGGESHANPVTAAALAELLRRVAAPPRPRLALTGGEPLEQQELLADLLPRLRSDGFEIHLETAGVHPAPLAALLPCLDHVAMDWKLPGTGTRDWREAHRRCLGLLGRWGGDQAVKVILAPGATLAGAAEAAREVARLSPGATLVLQPATDPATGRPFPDWVERGAAWAWELLPLHARIRVLPQLHRLLGVP